MAKLSAPTAAVPADDGSQGQPTPERRHKPDDDQIALEIKPRLESKVAFFRESGHNYTETGYWEKMDARELEQEIREELRAYRQYGIQVTSQRIQAVRRLIENDLYVPDRTIIAAEREQAHYINLRNGLLNVKTFKLEKHRRDLYFTSQLDYDYDPEAGCPHFHQFLRTSLVKDDSTEPDWQMIEALQEHYGLALTGLTQYQYAAWIIGQPASGKSALLRTTVHVCGDMATAIDMNQLGTNRYITAMAVGKRLMTCTEGDAGTVLVDGLFKAFTGGGDAIQAEVKYGAPFTFIPTAKIWWAMNNAPRTKDRSGAVLRRLFPILFPRTIPPEDRDPDLDQKLAEEKAGIFAWAFTGLMRLQRRGHFKMPDASARWLAEYEQRNDYPRLFRDEFMEPFDGYWIASSDLYGRYVEWCKAANVQPISMPHMRLEWERLGFQYRQVSSGSQYGGWRFKTSGLHGGQ